MPRAKRIPPYPKKPHATGQARIRIDGRDIYLGLFMSKESQEIYARVIAEHVRGAPKMVPMLTVSELLAAYWFKKADPYYRYQDGTPTSEHKDIKLSLRPLRQLYSSTQAKEFGPLQLKTVREQMITAGLCRKVINQRIGRIRRVWKWATTETPLLPHALYLALADLADLPKGRSPAKDHPDVEAVTAQDIEAIRDYITAPVWAMIQLQRLTGMRPGEVRTLRGIDLKIRGDQWSYEPETHKTAYRGKKKVLPLGEGAKKLLQPFLRPSVEEYLFSPRDACTLVFGKKPGILYSRTSYAKAVRVACTKAAIKPWHPHQIRHLFATEASRLFGKDHAQAALGHDSPQATARYDHSALDKAKEVMAKIG